MDFNLFRLRVTSLTSMAQCGGGGRGCNNLYFLIFKAPAVNGITAYLSNALIFMFLYLKKTIRTYIVQNIGKKCRNNISGHST